MKLVTAIEPIPSDWQDRPIVLQYNGNNELVTRSYGQTQEELLKAHKNGTCGIWCDYCYGCAIGELNEEDL